MRAETLRSLTPGTEWTWIDTDAPFLKSSRLWRSVAYRTKGGPAVKRINDSVREAIAGEKFDLVWLDKAVFLSENTMKQVRSAAHRMAHFTPDTAFHANRSAAFEKSMPLYDLLVTTKSFEIDEYRTRVAPDAVMLTTQGYDPAVHFPRNESGQRRREVAFAGLAEPDRERCIAALLQAGVHVRLGGIGWKRFLRKWGDYPALHFEGEEIFGEAYATLFSRAWIGLGLLTKRFPELHTTRTLEIPACGAALATERTSDTSTMFADDEALFFDDYDDLASRVAKLFGDDDTSPLSRIAAAGSQRVARDRRDYPVILAAILANPRLRLRDK